MKAGLRALLHSIAEVPASAERDVAGLALDSRRVRAQDLFLALPGAAADGREHIGSAVAAGAAVIVYECGDGYRPGNVPVPAIGVANLRQALGTIASRLYEAPSQKLMVIGVTGTNGKTTCTQLLAQAINMSSVSDPTSPLPKGEGRRQLSRCAIIGTIGVGFPDALNESMHTTPDAVAVHRLLREFLDAGADAVAMEVSSHALDQGRVNEVAFDLAVFTNLTRDHLDYHGSMESYATTKANLFEWPTLKHAVINSDDPFGRALQEKLRDKFNGRVATLTYGLDRADVTARRVSATPRGLLLEVTSPWGEAHLECPLFGRFNAYNALAVLAALLLLDVPLPDAIARLRRVRPVPGRVERFGGGNGQPLVIVDYAHTPDALEKVLASLREHARGKLVCVFGCGGDRDRGKRPLMGAAAERLADEVIVTDDNPRTEAPERIIDDIRAGMAGTHGAVRVIRDRAEAIAEAIAAAGSDDIVLVAGKGHEDYQQIGSTRFPYSDRATVRAILQGNNNGGVA